MAKRTGPEQSSHDRKVRELARQYKKEGYSVKADGVRGYKRPAAIGVHKRRPDIEATTKAGSRVIVEVETPSSLVTDKEQMKTFARHAAHKSRTKFHVVVTKPRKK